MGLKDQVDNTNDTEGEIWNYQQTSLGFNYRLNDIQAA